MIDESLLKSHNIGKDGFSWWIGQVCESDTWAANFPELPVDTDKDLPGFRRRVKVSILGYHTYSKEELPNDDLPWAYCLMPTSAGGGSGGFSESLALTGGEWVFGFFLDGTDGQQPVIIGLFDKSTQEDFRKDIPDIRYEPFSGFTNEKPAPLTNIKKLDTVESEGTGDADQNIGSGEVKTQKEKFIESATVEQGDVVEVLNQAEVFIKKNTEATGDMQVADNSECVDYQDAISQGVQRFSKVTTIMEEVNGVTREKEGLKIGNIEGEEKRLASIIATAQKFLQTNAMGATLEKMAEASSKFNSVAPLSQMLKADDANDEAATKLIGTFAEIIAALPLDAANFVKETKGKLVSQPPCVVENYTGAMLGKSLGNIDSKMNGIMGDVNKVLSSVDKGGSFAKMGMGAAKSLMGGGGLNSILSEGLNSLGGISIGLDGIQKFSTSFKKVYPGQMPLPCPKGKQLSALTGGMPLPPQMEKMGNVLEKFAADSTGLSQLASGISNFTDMNSLFSTAIDLDNTNLADLGGLGGITDALGKAKNLASFAKFPSGTGESIIESTKTMLAGGDTFDAALSAAETIFPGGREFVKETFQNQIEGQRFSGSSCETGPLASGPPIIEIWGGGGKGATANAVVGPNGNILAVDVTRQGQGYNTPPYCAVIDRSGVGFGAVLRAEIDEDEVEKTGSSGVIKIVVVEPGWDYLLSPDGSVGGNGVKFAAADNTVVKDKEGRFLPFKPKRGVKVPPGATIYLPVGSTCQLPVSAITTNGDPVFDAAAKVKGKIKSVQVNLRKGYKGFQKVTDGSAEGAGPILSIRDAVNDRKISNLLEVQTGSPFNLDYQPPNILKDYTDRVIKAKKGTVELSRFGAEGVDPKAKDKEWVRQQYHSLFCREPDAGGWRHWLGDLRKGDSRAKVLANMKIATPEYATRQAKIKSGEINPDECRFRWNKIPPKIDNFSTLDPWNADLEVGTIYTFRGVYNHHEPLTAAQIEDPYDLTRGNYRYFVFDYVMEVVETSSGYPWAVGIDRNKTKWWKLNQIKYVTGTQDFVNGETVTKWMRDYQGRLYELNITVCTFDDNTAEVIGHGLATNSEGFEVVKTPLLCDPPITQTKDANFQPVRWYREKPVRPRVRKPQTKVTTTKRTVPLNFAGLHVKNNPIRVTDSGKRLHLKDGHGNDANAEFIIDTGNVKFSGDGRSIVGAGKATITLRWNDNPRTAGTALGSIAFGGKTWTQSGRSGSLTQTVDIGDMIIDVTEVKPETTKKDTNIYTDKYVQGLGHIPGSEKHTLAREISLVYNSFGDKKLGYAYQDGRKYMDKSGLEYWIEGYLRHLKNLRKGLTCESEDFEVKRSTAGKPVPVTFNVKTASLYADSVRIEGLNINIGKEYGDGVDINESVTRQVEYGKVYAVTFNSVQGVERLRNNGDNTIEMEDLPPNRVQPVYFDDIVINSSIGKFYNIQGNTCSFIVEPLPLPSVIQKKRKKIEPITEEEYQNYKNNLNQKPEPHAFACLKKDILYSAKVNFEKWGQVIKEETYCEWAREYVDEVQKVFRPTNTIGYIVPCGAEITTPELHGDPIPTPTYPTTLEVDEIIVNQTGAGYNPGDTCIFNGEELPLKLTPTGGVIGIDGPLPGPFLDYPVITINSDTGAGADLECTLKVVPVPEDPELLPANIVEVIDCVGKNIFIKES
jgi:hypothetical protein